MRGLRCVAKFLCVCFTLCVKFALKNSLFSDQVCWNKEKTLHFICRRQYDYDPDSSTIGFQVDRVKHAESGEGKVRLTAYCKSTGQVGNSNLYNSSSSSSSSILFRNISSWVTMEPKAVTME